MMFFFKYADETKGTDLTKIIGSDQVIERAYEELNQFNWTEEELLTYEQETKRVMDNRAAEDYLINVAKAEGKAEGEAKGRAEGEAKGRAEGKKETKIKIAQRMLANGLSPTLVSAITGLDKDFVISLINNKS